MESSFNSLISFLPLFCNCQLISIPMLPRSYPDSLTSRNSTNSSKSESESKSYVTTDGQSASLSPNKGPICSLRPDFYYCQTVAGLLMLGALSDDRTGLSFKTAAGPRQRNHSRVRHRWDSRQYFTVSDSKLHFSSPPLIRRATVKVFDPVSTQDTNFSQLKSFYNHFARTTQKTQPLYC
jgi:hypothetical protein